MGEAGCNLIMSFLKLLSVAAKNDSRKEILSSVKMPTLSKHVYKPNKLVHNVVYVLDHPNKKICVNLLPYSVDKPDNS